MAGSTTPSHPIPSSVNRHTVLLAAVLLCAAAGSARLRAQEAPAPSAHGPALVTHEQLTATGRGNLADALRQLRPQWLRLNSARGGFAVVYVDSMHRGDVDVLTSFNVADVRWVQYSDPEVVEQRFGRGTRIPVIHVSTRLPLSAAHPDVPAPAPFESRPLLSLFATASRTTGDLAEEMDLRPGIGAGLELPATRNLAVTVAASYVPGEREGGTTEGNLALLTGEVGFKARLSSDRTLASFVSAGATAYHLRWGTVRANGEVRDEAYTENGFGLAAGAGVEMRVSRVLLFARADAAAPIISGRRAELLATFRLGSSFPLGSSR